MVFVMDQYEEKEMQLGGLADRRNLNVVLRTLRHGNNNLEEKRLRRYSGREGVRD